MVLFWRFWILDLYPFVLILFFYSFFWKMEESFFSSSGEIVVPEILCCIHKQGGNWRVRREKQPPGMALRETNNGKIGETDSWWLASRMLLVRAYDSHDVMAFRNDCPHPQHDLEIKISEQASCLLRFCTIVFINVDLSSFISRG